jgi:DNA modification methylase
LWLLGQHRLLCGDARDPATYETLLDGAKGQFAFTDPPYNVAINGNVCGLGRIRHGNFAMACGEMSESQFTEFLVVVMQRMAANTVDGSIHEIFMDWRHTAEMIAAGRQVYSELKNLWKNGSAPHVNAFELGQHGRSRSNLWTYAGANTVKPGRLHELAMHPTVKPVALVADAIRDCSRRNDLVLDPFAGSGTILIAADRTGRKARALEIDPNYVDVAVRRWQSYTGKVATLFATGETFEDVGERRQSTSMAA